ncbi:MAG: hypothetical protein Q7S36_02785 [Candidatus Liptonbacteria bacterium]|nr:hypothetical protein [Candidatus Liptonbacteria bacterium]
MPRLSKSVLEFKKDPMYSRRKKRKTAYAVNKRLRRKLYYGAAIATSVYVVLSLIRFHGEFAYLPYVLALIWAVFLLCYTTIKEVFRWNDAEDKEIYHGELWAGLVLAGAAWMIIWNLARAWIFHQPSIPFPEDYAGATVETIVIYTLSIISSFAHKYKTGSAQFMRRRKHRKPVRRALAPSAPDKSGLMNTNQAQNPEVEVVLTKTGAPDGKNSSKSQNS